MSINQQQLLQILPNARAVAGVFVPALNIAMDKYQINTRVRVAAFLAQVGHESSHLRALVENLNYSAAELMKVWPGRFDAALAAECASNPQKIANIAYASRLGNGAPATGDGWKFRGRGLIQVTGWTHYQACGAELGLNLLMKPELLEQPIYAALSAAWFWAANDLNGLADNGQFQAITQRINGGLNGQVDRLVIHQRALKVLA